jgi:hypothetical protein
MRDTFRKLQFAFNSFFIGAYASVIGLGLLMLLWVWILFWTPLAVAGVAGLTLAGLVFFFVQGYRKGGEVSFNVRREQLENWARSAGSKMEFDNRMALIGATAALGSVAALEAFGKDHGVPMTSSPFVADSGGPIVNTDGTPMLGSTLDVSGGIYGSSGALGGTDSFSSMDSAHSSFSSDSFGGGGF